VLIDTHCHLDFKDFDADRDEVIDRAKRAGVEKIINVGSSIEGTRRYMELARTHKAVYASIGVHPHEAQSVTGKVIEDFKKLASEKKVVAIGEVGLDYYRNNTPREKQVSSFKLFIRLAGELKLPLIIHSREADDDILDILRKECGGGLRGVMHCFSADEPFLKEILKLGLFVSFTCNLTFKNADRLRQTAKSMPVERLLLETDAPFLAPEGLRGKRNEPSYLVGLVDVWSRILGLSKDDIARITTHNANTLFGLDVEEKVKVVYEIRDSVYLNITNKCTNDCDFCVRNKTAFVKGHNLKLDREPSADEVIRYVGDPKRYREIVFCGYGEPLMRLDMVKKVAMELNAKGARSIRVVTNGQGDIINSRPVAPELAGLIDRISISLNTDNEDRYNKACRPKFGAGTYGRILDFIASCVKNNIVTEVTCLDLEEVDIRRCEEIAASLGAKFRLRKLGIVG